MAGSDSHFSGTRRRFDSTNGGEEVSENIASDITQLIGWTPLVEIKRISIAEGAVARIVGKLECYQPLSSVKDRIALKMIEDAEEKGLITPNVSTLIEPTSGNTGIGLALVGVRKGYKVIVVMPCYASLERRMVLKALGAEVYLSDPKGGFQGLIGLANDLLNSTPNSYMLNQLENEMNPRAHFETTGPEIWKDTAGKVDILVAGSGTGGTFSGVGRFLKAQNPNIKVVVVEPSENTAFTEGCKGPHKIEGIGPGFIPATANISLIDEIITISSEEAMSFTRRLISEEGLFVGISSGAAFAAALQVAKRSENAGKMIVVILPSGAERYLSTNLFATIRKECENMPFVPFKDPSQDAAQTQS